MILIDTNALVWFLARDPKLSDFARNALLAPTNELAVSIVTAFEYIDLERRGRFGGAGPLDAALTALNAGVAALPSDAYRVAETLPDIHRDPVDRMLVGHAISTGAAIVTSDRHIHRYPVATIW